MAEFCLAQRMFNDVVASLFKIKWTIQIENPTWIHNLLCELATALITVVHCIWGARELAHICTHIQTLISALNSGFVIIVQLKFRIRYHCDVQWMWFRVLWIHKRRKSPFKPISHGLWLLRRAEIFAAVCVVVVGVGVVGFVGVIVAVLVNELSLISDSASTTVDASLP